MFLENLKEGILNGLQGTVQLYAPRYNFPQTERVLDDVIEYEAIETNQHDT